MAKNNNLTDFLTDIANTIRTKKGTTLAINPQNFSSEIESIETGVDNPLIANSDAEMNTYLNDTKYLNMYVKFTGQSETYVTGETYKIVEEDADPTQYEPVGSTPSVKDFLTSRNGQYLFYNFTTLTNDQLNSIIKFDDTENVTNVYYMFHNCTSLTTIPLLDTSNVTIMGFMFSGCYKLTTIPLLDTSNVTNMNSMFSGCSALTTIPLLDTSKVTKISGMFDGCTNLTTIPLLNTSNVTNMSFMFSECKKLTKIDISKLADSNNDRFAYNCYSLKTLIIRTMNTIPSLQSSAFNKCYHFYGTVDATYNPDGLKDGRIYVPDDKVESLKTATNWSVFADIIVPLSTYVEEA